MSLANPLHSAFVCTGNICRSPMAEVIVRDALTAAGLGGDVRVTSSGIGGWHVGGPAGFTTTREQIEAAADGIVAWVRDRVQSQPRTD